MFTEKQIRNGADQGAAGHNTAVDDMGPMPAVPMTEAMSAADTYSNAGKAVFDGGGMEGMVSFVWDSGLAVADQPGEAGDG